MNRIGRAWLGAVVIAAAIVGGSLLLGHVRWTLAGVAIIAAASYLIGFSDGGWLIRTSPNEKGAPAGTSLDRASGERSHGKT